MTAGIIVGKILAVGSMGVLISMFNRKRYANFFLFKYTKYINKLYEFDRHISRELFCNHLNKCLNIDVHCSFRRARPSTVQSNGFHTDNPPENSEQNYINPVFDGTYIYILLH